MRYQDDFWRQYFIYYDVLLRVVPYQELFAEIISHLELESGEKILDLGAGTGNLLHFLPFEADVVSLDNSRSALSRLKAKFPQATTVRGSIMERLPFASDTFDRVVVNNVLYTLYRDEWDFPISEIQRVSKSKSRVIVSNLNKDFKALNIYKEHIQKSTKLKGLLATVRELAYLAYPTIKMLQFNKLINAENDADRYSFLKEGEQISRFEKHGFISLQETKMVYASQALLDVFENNKETKS